MRRQVFTAGLSVALVLGAAAPALAKPGHGPKDPKPPKTHPGRVDGGGTTQGGGHFSVEAKQDRLAKGHFNYESADGTLKVRCDGFDSYSPRVYVAPGPPAVDVTAHCVAKAPHHSRTPITLAATFVDNRDFHKADEVDITFTKGDGSTVSDSGALRDGNVVVR